jgi:AcrR family transcriptional regulator
MRPEDRLPALLDAALAVFTRKGFGSATLNDVAEQAGVTKGCLYHYFASKEQLLLTLMRERSKPTVDTAVPAPIAPAPIAPAPIAPAPVATRDEAIATIVRQIWAHFQDPGQLELTTLAITELPKAPELARALFDECVAEGRSTLCDALEDAARGGHAPSEDEAKLEATLIPYMIMGVALAQRLFRGIDPDAPSPAAVEHAMTRMLTRGI